MLVVNGDIAASYQVRASLPWLLPSSDHEAQDAVFGPKLQWNTDYEAMSPVRGSLKTDCSRTPTATAQPTAAEQRLNPLHRTNPPQRVLFRCGCTAAAVQETTQCSNFLLRCSEVFCCSEVLFRCSTAHCSRNPICSGPNPLQRTVHRCKPLQRMFVPLQQSSRQPGTLRIGTEIRCSGV